MSADGRGDPRPNVLLANFHWLVGWTPEGTLAYGMMENTGADGVSRGSIVALQKDESHPVVGPGQTWGGRLSANGRWLAYYLSDSGDFEIYVSPFPNTGARWLIAHVGKSASASSKDMCAWVPRNSFTSCERSSSVIGGLCRLPRQTDQSI